MNKLLLYKEITQHAEKRILDYMSDTKKPPEIRQAWASAVFTFWHELTVPFQDEGDFDRLKSYFQPKQVIQ